MNKNILIVIGGAVLVAVLVALLVQLTLGGKKKNVPVVAHVAKTHILVALKDMSIGYDLKEEDLKWQEWPQAHIFVGAIVKKTDTKIADMITGRLARNVAKGEPLLTSAMLSNDQGNFVAASLDKGMRAMAIKVTADSMVGGFIGPGDHVDIIMTYKESIKTDAKDDPRISEMMETNLDKLATETLLQNVKILAVDQLSQRPSEDQIKVGKTVSVAVNAQDAERLSLAAEFAELNLVLRGVGDDKIFEKTWDTISDARLTSMNNEIFREYKKIKGHKKRGHGGLMKIYNGGQMAVVQTN